MLCGGVRVYCPHDGELAAMMSHGFPFGAAGHTPGLDYLVDRSEFLPDSCANVIPCFLLCKYMLNHVLLYTLYCNDHVRIRITVLCTLLLRSLCTLNCFNPVLP
jgi:hypothetical protein